MEVPKNQEQIKKEQAEREMRNSILSQILTAEAKERLERIRIVRPEQTTNLENILIQMVQRNMISQRVDDRELVKLAKSCTDVESVSKIVTYRHHMDLDEEEINVESFLE